MGKYNQKNFVLQMEKVQTINHVPITTVTINNYCIYKYNLEEETIDICDACPWKISGLWKLLFKVRETF